MVETEYLYCRVLMYGHCCFKVILWWLYCVLTIQMLLGKVTFKEVVLHGHYKEVVLSSHYKEVVLCGH